MLPATSSYGTKQGSPPPNRCTNRDKQTKKWSQSTSVSMSPLLTGSVQYCLQNSFTGFEISGGL